MSENQNQKSNLTEAELKAAADKKAADDKAKADKAAADKKAADDKAKADKAAADKKAKEEKEKKPKALKSLKDQTLYIKGLGSRFFKKGQEPTDEELAAMKARGVILETYFK